MTPQIALDLSLDGIVVLSRAPAGPDRGKWWREGIVRLDDENMSEHLRRMRARCAARVGEDFTSILVIPDSQILFTSLERDDRNPRTTIRALLKGRTPYPVEDLAFDFVERGDRLQVAVVALDTLLEAETFASDYGFRPVALVGNPTDSPYPGIPNFGPTGAAADLLHGAPLTLDLGAGFNVVPAPDAPDLAETAQETGAPAPDSSAAPPSSAEAAADPAPRPGDGAPREIRVTEPDPAIILPEHTAPRVTLAPPLPPSSVIPPGTPLPAEASRPRLEPVAPAAVASDVPSDFAAAMAATPDAPPEGYDPGDGTEVGRDFPADRDDAVSSDAPAFSTRRRAPAAGTARAEPGLSRITPRISRPSSDDGASESGPGLAPIVARTPKRSPSDRAGAGAVETSSGSDFAPEPKRAGSGRLGLYLTLSLLVILGLLALWAVAFRGDDVSSLASSADTPTAAVTDPAPAAPGGGTGTDTSTAELISPGGTTAPEPSGPAEDDLALLLPDSQGTPAATDPAADPAITPTTGTDDSPEASVEASVEGPSDVDAADEEAALAVDEAAAADSALGIAVVTTDAKPFELPRDIADAPDTGNADDIYVASIDPVIAGSDAVALPRAEPPGDTFSPQTSPAPAGSNFDTGSDGLVVATASPTLAPGGYSVIAGRPATLPVPRPSETAVQQATQGAADDAARTELEGTRPTPRPQDAPERAERLTFNGLTRAELTRTPPVRRPAAISEAVARTEAASSRQAAAVQAAASAAVASLAQTEAPASLQEPDVAEAISQSQYALAQSWRPRERPPSVEQDAARIVTQRREETAPAAVASASSARLPAAADSSRQTLRSPGGSVSRAATQSNQIRLREMNLIGVYGRPNARRALVRLPNGRYVKIEVGDRLERGRVIAIGESEVVYQQNGRNYALRMPQS